MNEYMYDINRMSIALVLLITIMLAVEAGCRIGMRKHAYRSDAFKSHVNATSASLLGVLALILGFTFSLSLQRFDARSDAVVNEANAIGTAYLRAQLLPAPISDDARKMLGDYLDLRIRMSTLDVSDHAGRETLLGKTNQAQAALWACARQAAAGTQSPVMAGLFVQSINDLIDAFGRRDAALNRHVPETVLLLLYVSLLMAGAVAGYAAGVAGHHASFATYIMVTLIVVLVAVILDLDRPRRGLIQVSQKSLVDLQATIPATTR